mgnify:CR=1 FL=1
MLFDILFILFFFFTHKQMYAGRHFTGDKVIVGRVLYGISWINIILMFTFLIYMSCSDSILHAIVLFFAALILSSFILNGITTKIGYAIANAGNGYNTVASYNYQCDVVSTVTAYIGVIANLFIIITFVCSALI